MSALIYPARLRGCVRAPASKSQAHRLLILAALSDAPSQIHLANLCADLEATLGALQALGKNPNHILIAGVDGTPDALQMLKSGKMIATIFQDAKGQGEGAVDAAIKLANGEKVEKIIDVPYQLITKENMAEFTNRNQK